MIKINIITISLILFLTNCGFSPIYYNNMNINFSIEEVDYTGDRELNNFLRINLDKYKSEEINNKIFIEAESKYEKNILSKDSTGKVTSYQLEAQVIFLIKSLQTNNMHLGKVLMIISNTALPIKLMLTTEK